MSFQKQKPVVKREIFTGDSALLLQGEDGFEMFSCCEEHRAELLAMDTRGVWWLWSHCTPERWNFLLAQAQGGILHNAWGWGYCRSYQRAPKRETGAWPGLMVTPEAIGALWEGQGRGICWDREFLTLPGGLQEWGEKNWNLEYIGK